MEITLNDSNFEKEVLQSEQPCLVDFWAPWCGPCRMIAPVIEEIAQEYAGKLKVGKLNVDQVSSIAGKYGVMSIPTLAFFKGGQVVQTIVGALPKEEIIKQIESRL